MLKRIALIVLALPVAVFLVTLAVANRHATRLVLDPFRPEAPVISVELPFYAYLFGSLLLGVIAGGTAVWMSQSHWRQTARVRTQEARRWHAEADRLARERDADVGRTKPLAIAGR